MYTVGIYLDSGPERLRATLASLARHTSGLRIVLLPDAPDPALRATLAALNHYPQLASAEPRGAAAAFNRLLALDDAPVVVLLESGVVVTAGWLERLLAALEQPGVGLAGPSTNYAWNEQRLRDAPGWGARPTEVDAYAARLATRFGAESATLEPLYSLSDFCYAVKRAVVDAIGGADAGYALGPCWEMDYNARAARAGFAGVWVKGAFVYRPAHSARRAQNEQRYFEASRRHYQDRLCGLRLQGQQADYEAHCRGDACPHFAPTALIHLRQPLDRSSSPVGALQVEAPAQLPSDQLVSCIMPTFNRRAFIPQALRCFLRQDYPNLELLILDDGTDPVADLVPDDQRIRYIRLDGRRTIGAKRNLACAQARGQFIVHWDDDDWYPPWRVRVQVSALLHGPADLCGSSRLYYYQAAHDRAWCYEYVAHGTAWVAGNTLAYRKRFWERSRFPEIQVGEDSRFVWSAAPETICDLAEPSLCVGMIHSANTSPKNTTSAYWHPEACDQIHALLGEDLLPCRAASLPQNSASVPGVHLPAQPLVSCIMPTHNRRQFVALALANFLGQDHPNKELIIVDDGPDPVGDLLKDLPDIHYLHIPQRMTIGGKRNLACQHARGEIIAHWDDDDWYAPERLRYQAAPILAGQADITGLQNSFVLNLTDGTFWTVSPQLHQRMFVGDIHGGTLMYRRSLIVEGLSYPQINLAEDAYLINQAMRRGKRLVRLPNAGVFVYVRHGNNAWQFVTGHFLDPAGWRPVEHPDTFPADLLASYQQAALPAPIPAGA